MVLRLAGFPVILATDSRNMDDPMITGLPGMMLNVPFTGQPLVPALGRFADTAVNLYVKIISGPPLANAFGYFVVRDARVGVRVF